jgi:ribA/ribD-fused uncharacterized protein
MDNIIKFWGTDGPYGCFSNFYPCTFTYAGRKFNCSEQAFMWAKATYFKDDETAIKIMSESDPKKIKKLGRTVKDFNDEEWSKVRYNFMLTINMAKYSQNEDLKNILLSTINRTIVEDSPFDYIWGIGKNGTGQNLLGKVLMETRDWLRR